MKRITWLLLFAFLLSSFPLGLAAPSPAPVTTSPIITLDACAADHFHPVSGEYIGNNNSGIFHYAGCRYVARMAENHKVYFDTRDEAISAGYRPCKVCKP